MMKIIITNIYFGKLPEIFDLFLRSCGNNREIDFLFFVDDHINLPIPENVKIVRSSLLDFQKRFAAIIGSPIKLTKPYKLCDFTPALGHLLEMEFNGYDWWGHCDFDMILGDLRPMIELVKSGRYAKIFRRGHLMLFKNCASVNTMYRERRFGIDYRKALNTEETVAFDEASGIQAIFERAGLPVFIGEWMADINPRSPFLATTKHKNRFDNYFVTNGRRLLRRAVFDPNANDEFLYIHLQKRLIPIQRPIIGELCITPIKIFGFTGSNPHGVGPLGQLAPCVPNLSQVWSYGRRRMRNAQRKIKRVLTLQG